MGALLIPSATLIRLLKLGQGPYRDAPAGGKE